MKVIFLDIDGVLATGETFNKNVEVNGEGFCPFYKGAVYNLNKITAATGAVLCISSSWRCGGPRWDALVEHFKQQGVEGQIIGRTPQLERKSPGGVYMAVQRGEEIKAWLSTDVSHYVALDDDSDMDAIPGHFVHVRNGSWRGGLLNSHAQCAIAILKDTP